MIFSSPTELPFENYFILASIRHERRPTESCRAPVVLGDSQSEREMFHNNSSAPPRAANYKLRMWPTGSVRKTTTKHFVTFVCLVLTFGANRSSAFWLTDASLFDKPAGPTITSSSPAEQATISSLAEAEKPSNSPADSGPTLQVKPNETNNSAASDQPDTKWMQLQVDAASGRRPAPVGTQDKQVSKCRRMGSTPRLLHAGCVRVLSSLVSRLPMPPRAAAAAKRAQRGSRRPDPIRHAPIGGEPAALVNRSSRTNPAAVCPTFGLKSSCRTASRNYPLRDTGAPHRSRACMQLTRANNQTSA
jgi:hypothetical protein